MNNEARLLLEDGTLFTGRSFGSDLDTIGEVVFCTGMTGYQEMLTDPSAFGQIVMMTYPLIGSYGINRDDFQSIRPHISGLIVREYEEIPSNWRAQYTLSNFLMENGIPAISGIDTRQLTRIIRSQGTMNAVLSTTGEPLEALQQRLEHFRPPNDQVKRVSTSAVYHAPGEGERIVVVDFGAKRSLLRALTKRGCDVIVVPYHVTADEIRRLHPDGIVLSNGPGNPQDVPEAISMVRDLLGEIPLFGVCLGHQIFALASGAQVEKMKFGHRGGNYPVKSLEHGSCYITSQNHGYTVIPKSLEQTPLKVTFVNNNDQTIEGLKHKHVPAFSVQFHPEAGPGPADSGCLYDDFLKLIRQHKQLNPQPPRQAQMLQVIRKGDKSYAQK